MKNFYFNICKKDAIRFSQISNDKNPIHINSRIGLSSIYRKNISHGVLLVLKNLNKVKNISNYLNQDYSISINFLKPIFFDSEILSIYKVKKNFFGIDSYQDNQKICNIIFNKKKEIKTKDVVVKKDKKSFFLEPKKSLIYKFDSKSRPLQDLLCSISYYVGMINPGEKGILNTITINWTKNIISNDTKILINTKKTDKRFKLYTNELLYGKFNAIFTTSVRTEYDIINYDNNKLVKKIVKKIDKDVLIISGSSALGESFINLLKDNNKIKIISTFSTTRPKINIYKNFSIKKIILEKDLYKLKKIILNMNKPYVFYFSSPPINFGRNLSKKTIYLYKKLFTKIPVSILNDVSLNISKFIYPSSTNIEYDKKSIYSKEKINAEKQLKKFKKCFIYRFDKLYSKNTISIQNSNIINLQKLLNKKPQLLNNFFK